jgi:hypothetical protein
VAEQYDGASVSCPADVKSEALCRSAAGDCDLAETCDGVSNDCPADSVAGAFLVCRSAAGDCDVAETCDGVSATCPADGFASSATVCRSAAGACDLAEQCTGSSAACPSDATSPDTDGDTVCDVADNCPNDANTDQANGDSDPLGDVCDPCTGGAVAIKHKITITKLLTAPGDDKLSFKAQATFVPPTFSPALNPQANGIRLLIVDASSHTMLDATVPGSVYNPTTHIGWKVNGSGTSWTYKNPLGDSNGLITVGVKTTPSKPGLVKVKAKGKNSDYTVHQNHLPLQVTFILDPPTAETGECIESLWPALFPTKPSCSVASAGGTVKCK